MSALHVADQLRTKQGPRELVARFHKITQFLASKLFIMAIIDPLFMEISISTSYFLRYGMNET